MGLLLYWWLLAAVLQPTAGITAVAVVWSLSDVQLFAVPWTAAHQDPLSKGFPRHEYWSGLPFPSPGDLPNSGIEPKAPAWAAGFFTTEPLVLVRYYRLIRDLEMEGGPPEPTTLWVVHTLTALNTVSSTPPYEAVYTRILFSPLGCIHGSPGLDMTQFQNQFTGETIPWIQKELLGEQIWLTRYEKL